MKTDIEPVSKEGVLEKVITEGDLSLLPPADRVMYYKTVCESVGLNPFTKPFEYIKLNGKLTLYAKRDATDQLRKIHGISVQIVARETVGDVYVVTARATDVTGRADESIGAVPLKGLQGESLANAFMKAETKAKRRVTLSIAGLGMLDETEISSIPGAQVLPSGPEEHPASKEERREPPRKSENSFISEAQAKRLFALSHEYGVSLDSLKEYLKGHYGIDSSKQIKKSDYDTICQWVESFAPVPEDDREPGEEG